MMMPGRQFSAGGGYRYGFNGKENDAETATQDYGMRIYDTRLGKFLSVDPLSNQFPWNSVYSYAEGDPINYIDLDGGEKPPTKAQALPVAKRSVIQPVHSEAPPLAVQQAKQRAMLMGPPMTPEQKSAADRATIIRQLQSRQATLSQGGYLGSKEYKLSKANYDTYGKYLPGISDIDDGLSLIGDVKDGNYKSAVFSTLFFLPGGDFLKPLKNLKGAGKLGGSACMDYAKSFMSKYGKQIEDAGGSVTKMEIRIGGDGIIGTLDKQLSNNGIHQFIEVADKAGNVKIFDNAHPEGILKADYLETLAGSSGKIGIKEGKELYEQFAKKVDK